MDSDHIAPLKKARGVIFCLHLNAEHTFLLKKIMFFSILFVMNEEFFRHQ